MKTLTISKQAPGLFDYVNRMAELQEHSSALDRLDQVIDWEKFRPTLEKTFEGSAQGPGGRPLIVTCTNSAETLSGFSHTGIL